MKMNKNSIVTFGEILLRFSKPDHLRLTQGRDLYGNYGGSEANVAVSLATLGDSVEFVSRVPQSATGRAACMKLREMGVDTGNMLFGGDRLGAYYFEEAAAMRNSQVVYDRNFSSFYFLEPGMIDWRKVLDGAKVFHTSGITTAISQQAADATFEALAIADEMGLTMSFDINYRKNLWKYGAEPRATLSRMLQYSDVVFADYIEFEYLLQLPPVPFRAVDGTYQIDVDLYRPWFDEIHRRFPRCRKWLMGIRNQVSSSHHALTALLWSDGEILSTRVYDIPGIVDPMGVGDAFMAGCLHASLAWPGNDQLCLDYSLAAAALKNSIPGDCNLSTDEEIWALMNR